MFPNFVKTIGVMLLLTGCSRYNYAPNPVHIPYISAAHDYTVGLNLGHPSFTGFVEADMTYNPFKNITVLGNASYGGGSIRNAFGATSENGQIRQYYAEIAAGGKFFLWHSGVSLGVYGGAGSGQVYNHYLNEPFSRLNYSKIFIQPTLAYQAKIIRLGLGVRYAQVNFGKGTIDADIPLNDLYRIEAIESDSPFNIFETGFQIGLHFHKTTISFGMFKGLMAGNRDLFRYGFNLSNVIFGCNLELSRKRK